MASVASRGVSVVVSFVTIPLLVGLFGETDYGYWVTITSVGSMLAFADLGIGGGLINRVATLSVASDHGAIRRSVSSAFVVLSAIAAVAVACSTVIYGLLSCQTQFQARESIFAGEFGLTTLIVVVCLLAALPFSIVQRVQLAVRQGYMVQIWQAAGVLAGLAALLLAIGWHGSMPVVALCISGSALLSVVMNWMFYFLRSRPEWRPRLDSWSKVEGGALLTSGFFFFVLQAGGVLVFSIDNVILLHFFGADVVTQYNLVSRLYQVPNMIAAMGFSALWPAYNHAIARNDMSWVRRGLLATTIMVSLAAVFCVLVLSWWIKPIVFGWTGVRVHPNPSLLAAFSLSAVLITGTSSISIFLNARRFMKQQALLVLLYALISLPLAIVLPGLIGPEGVAWSIVFGYLVVVVPGYCVFVPRALRGPAAP